jgi:exodeoxyribonuclease VII small subunit
VFRRDDTYPPWGCATSTEEEYAGKGRSMPDKQKRQRKKDKQPPPTFEEALSRLEDIARQLEDGELPLEKAISLAEEGLKLSELCEKQLTEAEGKIQQLVERMGSFEVEPLSEDTGESDEEV